MTSQNPTARLRPFRPVPFGRYTLLAELAKGGMGEIFLARMEGPNGFEKLCVIKKILPHLTAEADFVDRFVNEAKTLVKLSHGSIAQVLDMGVVDGEPYLALEHVDGKDLRKIAGRMRDRQIPTPLTVVLYVMSRVLDALAYAHRKRDDDEREIGLVHRDISPQNILVSYEGEVKVIDFGLAKSTLSSAKTNPSIILGKFLYMAPEQARHTGVDRRSDLYSAGLCLYELIHGKNPFDDAPAGELMASVANPNIAPLGQVEPLCPPSVSAVVMKALAVNPSQRFQTAEEFRGKLLSCLLDIDPAAGPESVTRFMREAFAAEYQAERRMLTQLRDSLRSPATPMPIRADTGVVQIQGGRLPAERITVPKAEVTPLLMKARAGGLKPSDGITEAEVPFLPPPSSGTETTAPRSILGADVGLPAAPSGASSPRLTAVTGSTRAPAFSDTQPRAPSPLEDTHPRRVAPPDSGLRLPFDDDTDPRRGAPKDQPDTDPRAPFPGRQPDTQPRSLFPDRSSGTQPRAHAPLEDTHPRAALPKDRDDETQPRAGMPEPRVVIGTLLGDDEDELSPSALRSGARKPVLPSPEGRIDVPDDPRAMGPTQELPANDSLAATQQVYGALAATQELPSPPSSQAATQQLPVLPFQSSTQRTSVWIFVVPIVLLTFGAVAYFLYDMHRSGAFLAEGISTTNRPSDLTPVEPTPQLGPPAIVAAPSGAAPVNAAPDAGVAAAAPDELDLEPLTAPVKKTTRRRAAPPRNSALQKEWTRARSAFTTLERARPCELPSMALLCSRYEDLKRDIDTAGASSDEEARLMTRVKAFKAAVDQKSSRR